MSPVSSYIICADVTIQRTHCNNNIHYQLGCYILLHERHVALNGVKESTLSDSVMRFLV